jgi:O-antigen ligase
VRTGVAESRTAVGGRSRLRLSHLTWAAGQVFSFETAFVLFLFAGAYKNDPRFAWFPGDMTLVFCFLSGIAGLVPLLRGSLFYLPGIKTMWPGVLLVLWIAASLAWSPSEFYANEKLTLTATGNLWCLAATAMIIGSSRVRVWRFFGVLLVFGVLASLDNILSFTAATGFWRVDHYLVLGRLASMAALIAFVLWLRSPPLSARGLVFLASFIVCGYVLLIIGGRTPTTGVAVGMLVPPLLSFRLQGAQLVINRRILASLGLIAVLALVIVSVAVSSEDALRTLGRFDKLLSTGSGAHARSSFWLHSLEYWAERPLIGHGAGAFSILYFNLDIHRHPHNLILELLAEFGLIGLALFAVLVLVLAWRVSVRRLREDPALMLAVMLCINTFINAMTSGDISDNRNLFATLGLLAMRPPGGAIDAATKSRPPHLGGPDLRGANSPQTGTLAKGQQPSSCSKRGTRALR